MLRDLTDDERALVRWLLTNGADDAASYAMQLDRISVNSVCPCGCASINFAIDDTTPDKNSGIKILADYQSDAVDGVVVGVFLFAYGDLLAGLEVWSPDGESDCKVLPKPSTLRPQVAHNGG